MGIRTFWIVFATAALTFMTLIVITALMSAAPHAERIPVLCSADPSQSVIHLPRPGHSGMALEDAIGGRRSVREYSDGSLSLEELSQLLWAGQGITDASGKRAAPSAGALYPITLYVIPNRVEGAGCGIYAYVPSGHKLVLAREGEFSDEAYRSTLMQFPVRDAAAVIVFAAARERTASKYGDRADLYIAIEAGHISQNILLESVSLGLGAVPIGAFDGSVMDSVLGIEGSGERSIYINAVGRPG